MATSEKQSMSPFGAELRRAREARGLSQLKLAMLASTSPRYVSFIETGRSRPSRAVVLRIAEALDVGLRERNRMLVAAGLSPAYAVRSLEEPTLSPFRGIIGDILKRHNPYPALVFDAAYDLLEANESAHRLLPSIVSLGWVDAMFAPESALRHAMENFAEVAWSMLASMRHEAGHAVDGPMHEKIGRMERYLSDVPRPEVLAATETSPVLLTRFRFGDTTVSTVTTVLRFGAARDVTLEELRVELVFPADAASARFFELSC
jgi:transcriptional regulator with XRE-family HTH domain